MTEKKHNKAKKEEKTHAVHTVQHMRVGTRGRIFQGVVTKKFPKRVVIESEKTLYVAKYERFYKKKMRLHARLPEGMDVQLGDLIKIQECRPLSKIIHAVVIGKVNPGATEAKK